VGESRRQPLLLVSTVTAPILDSTTYSQQGPRFQGLERLEHVGNKRFLRMMFGPGAEAAVQTYINAMEGNDPELLGVLMLNVSTDHIIRKFKVRDGTAFGFDENDAELVRVPLKEPTMVRPFFDENVNAYRYNVT